MKIFNIMTTIEKRVHKSTRLIKIKKICLSLECTTTNEIKHEEDCVQSAMKDGILFQSPTLPEPKLKTKCPKQYFIAHTTSYCFGECCMMFPSSRKLTVILPKL